VNQDELRAIYRESDVLVLPSFGEGLPVVLMEAMAMEIPCVATWIAGIPELIRDGIDGLLTPPADEQALARAILRLKTDPALRLRIGREARRRVLDQYDVGKNVERVAEVFRRRLGLRLARKA
jgi:glycosyltransferase involved in cell wall biosynthesis